MDGVMCKNLIATKYSEEISQSYNIIMLQNLQLD